MLTMPYARKVGPLEEAQIKERYGAGENALEIASVLGVCAATVRATLRKLGLKLDRGPRISEDRARQAITLLAEGWSAREVGRRLGLSRRRIHNLQETRAGQVKDELLTAQKEQVLRLRLEGHSAGAIAKQLKVRPRRILYILELLGLPGDRHAPRTGLTAQQIEVIIVSYLRGDSTQDLGQQFGVADGTIAGVLRRHGVSLRRSGFQTGTSHHNWNGGKYVHGGYVMVRLQPDDPFFSMARKKVDGASYVLEHRYVMAKSLGRVLGDHETVHHIDGDRANNRIENLQLRKGRHGAGQAHRCADCGSTNIVSTRLS